MLKEIKIQNFKVFQDIHITNLSRIVILGGDNNSGKTSFLEAIFLLQDAVDPRWFINQLSFRGIRNIAPEPLVSWAPFFYEHNLEQDIHIESNQHSLNIQYNKNTDASILQKMAEAMYQPSVGVPAQNWVSQQSEREPSLTVTCRLLSKKPKNLLQYVMTYHNSAQVVGNAMMNSNYIQQQFGIKHAYLEHTGLIESVITSLIHASGFYDHYDLATKFNLMRLDKAKIQQMMVLMQTIVPDLIDMRTEVYYGFPMIYLSLKDRNNSYPISHFGSAVLKVLTWGIRIMQENCQILLIDEIENGIHHERQQAVFSALFDIAVKFDCQIIATTHSYEFLQNLNELLLNSQARLQEDFTYIKFKKLTTGIEPAVVEVVTYNRLVSAGGEIR